MASYEIILMQNPDVDDPIAFKVVPQPGEEGPITSIESAEAIEAALALTGADDIYAKVMANIYRYGHVLREHEEYLEDTINTLTPVPKLMSAYHALYAADSEDYIPRALDEAVDGLSRSEGLMVLDSEGYFIHGAKGRESAYRLLDTLGNMIFTAKDIELGLASDLNASLVAFRTDVVWTTDERGISGPRFMSDDQYYVLGRIGLSGEFEAAASLQFGEGE